MRIWKRPHEALNMAFRDASRADAIRSSAIKATPAMAAGLTDRVWMMADIVAMIEESEMAQMVETLVSAAHAE